jgi:flagellar assembly factor FliW
MPCCRTRYFGTAEFDNDAVIAFPEGLPGFSGETEFLILQRQAEYPLVYLQSAHTPDLCFLALPVLTVDNNYLLELSLEDARILGTSTVPRIGEEVLCLVLVAVREGEPTANLFAPIVVNLATRAAAQCFLNASQYSHQHSLARTEREVAA